MEQASFGVGLVDTVAQDADEVGFSGLDFLASQVLPLTAGSAVVEVQMKPEAASGNYELALLAYVQALLKSKHQTWIELPPELRPKWWREKFARHIALLPEFPGSWFPKRKLLVSTTTLLGQGQTFWDELTALVDVEPPAPVFSEC
ncbi:unnamed protein product [Symbiodinium sp. CCMP2592]|nr:unnamed protein product [Symbiodinium sp. CCMP2592]